MKLLDKLRIIKRKLNSRKTSFSFGGVDLLINYIFKDVKKGMYLDVGCQHPISNNNTYLLYKSGWRGMNIDLDQRNIDLFNLDRPHDININSAISNQNEERNLFYFHKGSPINTLDEEISEINKNKIQNIKKIKTQTLNFYLKKFNFNKIDFLSIDVEGYEYKVLESINLSLYKPKIICVEYLDKNLKKLEFKNNILENVTKSDLYNLLINNNYHLINWNHADLLFAHKDFRDN